MLPSVLPNFSCHSTEELAGTFNVDPRALHKVESSYRILLLLYDMDSCSYATVEVKHLKSRGLNREEIML